MESRAQNDVKKVKKKKKNKRWLESFEHKSEMLYGIIVILIGNEWWFRSIEYENL